MKLNEAVAFGSCVSMWAPEKSNAFGADCDHAPCGEYMIEGSLSGIDTFTAAKTVVILRV